MFASPFTQQSVSFKNRLKSAQREKAREFALLTETGEKTALYCLAIHDWKLEVALDNYFASPGIFSREKIHL
jgi:DCN1-like protein 1/2